MKKIFISIFVMALFLLSQGEVAHAVLASAGPPDPASRFPTYYRDTTGLAIGPCFSSALSPNVLPPVPFPNPAATSMCFLASLNPQIPPDPYIPGNPIVWPTNFPEEWFYWNARACDKRSVNPACLPGVGDITNGVVVREIRFALEGTFATLPPLVADGNQTVFARTRIWFEVPNVPAAAGTYVLTHPYGVKVWTGVTAGATIRETVDVAPGIPLNFTGALNGGIGPFLVWTPDPAFSLTVGTERFVGDPGIAHTVTGSPLGTNFVRIDGPAGSNIGGPGIDFVQTNLFLVTGQIHSGALNKNDFDTDGKTDIGVWRQGNGTWYVIKSAGGFIETPWGTAGDIPVSGDYDGDGKTDLAVWRPSNGTWYVIKSSGGLIETAWGTNGDIPVPGDFDGDGKTDLAVWRSGTWYILTSSSNYTASIEFTWGIAGDIPVIGDFDGDGKMDLAVWRPSNGTWYILNSSNQKVTQTVWGALGDIPVPGDYDGDGKTDLAFYRPISVTNPLMTWYVLPSGGGQAFALQVGGGVNDIPVVGDYDKDGITDIAVFNSGTGFWTIVPSGTGVPTHTQWGTSGDKPLSLSWQ